MESKGTAAAVATALATALVLKLVAFDFVISEGRSMLPTVRPGSILLVDRLAYGLTLPFARSYLLRWAEPAAGDIVVFVAPDGTNAIKRCAAVPGDAVRVDADGVAVGRNHFPDPTAERSRFESFLAVPEGYFLALGDNPAESLDSRSYGFVAIDRIRGKVMGRRR